MPAAVIRLQSKLIQMKESRVLKVIGIILISIVIIILGLFKFWKETHNELQDNTNYIFKMIIAMDLGLDEQESDDLISSLSKEDTTDIDDILTQVCKKYNVGFVNFSGHFIRFAGVRLCFSRLFSPFCTKKQDSVAAARSRSPPLMDVGSRRKLKTSLWQTPYPR